MAQFPGFEQWAAQNGYAPRVSGSDDGGERYAPGAEGAYYAAKYGLSPQSSISNIFGPQRGVGSAEDLFNAMATGVEGSNLPIMNLSPERREQIIQGALGSGGQISGGLNFDSQMTPQERAAVEQYRAYEAPSDIWDTLLPLAFSAGFGGLVGPSILNSIAGGTGEAGATLLNGAEGIADAAWGVNPASNGLTLGGEAPWWADTGTIGMGDPMTAAGIGGGATPAGTGLGMGAASQGGFNVADYIRTGNIPGGSGAQPPAIPGVGNGVGLTEVAQAGLQQAGQTALSRVMNGTATAADWAQIAGSVGAAGLGMAGANAQGKAFSDVADKYLAMGAPYRGKLEASYAPGFNMATADPAFQGALDQSAQAAARSWSARAGNPSDSPTAMAEINKYVLNSSYLPQLNTYRSQLGSFGQLGTNTAGTNDTQAAGQTSGMYNAAGYGLGQLTQPKNPYEDAMKGLLGGFKLNQGMSF